MFLAKELLPQQKCRWAANQSQLCCSGCHSTGGDGGPSASPPPVHLAEPPGLSEHILKTTGGFPGGAVVENPPANSGDMGSSPGLGRSHMPQSN